MGQRTRDPTRLLPALLLLFVVCAVSIVSCDRTENEERYLRIPALGRTAQLGHLYNEVLDDFRDVSVFSQKIPEEFVTKAIKPKLTTISGPTNTYYEKFKLLNIQETVAANILAGFTQVEGSSTFLNDETVQINLPNKMSAALIRKYRTVKESLEFYFTKLKGLYNVDVLNHKAATHVVTGITYGADIAVVFKGNGKTSENSKTENTELHEQMELLNGHELKAKEINSSFTMSLTSDVPLPFKISTNLTHVYNLLQEMPARISNFTEGKGLPVIYTLTPLTVIKKLVLSNPEPSNSANEINIWLLKEIISHFDEVASVERQTNFLYKTLHSQPNCLVEEAEEKVEKLKASIQELKSNLTTGFHEALKTDRMASGPNSALRELNQMFYSNQFGAKNLKRRLSEFNDDLRRTAFCASLTISHPNIEYVGRELNFDLKISAHFNQTVYVLFTKAEFTNRNSSEWQVNLYTFLNQLNQPENRLYIVDCDFKHAMCINVSRSVIRLYRNGRLVSPKVEGVYEEEVGNLHAQISQLNSTLEAIIVGEVQRSAKLTAVETEVTRNRNDISALQAGLNVVNHTAAIQNQHPTSVPVANICEVQKPDFIANATKSASFGCGGTIQLPSKGESIVVDFNLPATNGVSQRCLWTLDATQNNKFVQFKVKLTLLCQHPTRILDENTLTFTKWHGNGPTYKEITTSRINSSSQNPFLLSNHWDYRGFLSFNAKTTDSEAGFIFLVDVTETLVSSSVATSSTTHTESVGSVSYSLRSSVDLSVDSIIINPQPAATMTLTVDVDSSGHSDPCQDFDSVDILGFGMDGVPKQLGRYCGWQSIILHEMENSVAALFLWDSKKSGRWVKLSWN